MPSTARPESRVGRKGLRVVVAAQVCLATIGCGAALAATGGGGITSPNPPRVTDVICQNQCVGLRDANPGARVQLTGRSLDYVEEVQFDQKGGGRIGAPAQNVTATAVEAIVPDEAVTGKPQVVDAMGTTSESPEELKITAAAAPADPGDGDTGGGETAAADRRHTTAASPAGISDVSANPSRGYFMGQQAKASFILQGRSAQDIRVDVVHKSDGSVVDSLVAKGVEPGSPAEIKWNGKTGDKKIAPNGEYEFEVKPMAGGNGERAELRAVRPHLPASAATTSTGRVSATAAATRASTSAPSAASGWSPPAAARSRPRPTTRPPATTSSSTARTRTSTTPTCTSASRPS